MRPSSRFRTAIAGPLALAGDRGDHARARARDPPALRTDGVVFWLGQINLTLLVFNMRAALPLDGSRVLRSLIRGAKDSRRVLALLLVREREIERDPTEATGALEGEPRRRPRLSRPSLRPSA